MGALHCLSRMLGGAEALMVGGSSLSAEEPLRLLPFDLGCRQPGLLSWGRGWLESKRRQRQSPLGGSRRMGECVQVVTPPHPRGCVQTTHMCATDLHTPQPGCMG